MNSQIKKILVNCHSARSGGAISYFQNAVTRILKEGNELGRAQFYALCNGSQVEQVDVDPEWIVTANTVHLSGLKRSIWEKRNLPRIVAEHRFSTVFTPYQVSNARFEAKSVLMLRNMEPFFFDRYRYSIKTKLRNRMLRHMTIRSTKTADHVIAVSDFACNHLIHQIGVPAARVSRIYHGSDPFFSETVEEDSADELLKSMGIHRPFLLTCGSLLPYRRCEDVIRAFALIGEDADAELDLIIAGEGNDLRYRNMLLKVAHESNVAERIRFVGHVSKQHIRILYQYARLVILATEIEACPNIAIEALTAGAAIVASDSDPLPEIIGRENASFFEKRNTTQLSQQIRHLLCMPENSARLRICARDRANDFCWQTCAAETMKLLEQI